MICKVIPLKEDANGMFKKLTNEAKTIDLPAVPHRGELIILKGDKKFIVAVVSVVYQEDGPVLISGIDVTEEEKGEIEG